MNDETGSITGAFTARFKSELDSATAEAERRLGGHAVRIYRIAYGDPREPNLISVDTAVGRLLRDAPLLAPIIDISVVAVTDDYTVIFVRPSSHRPVPWDNTWGLPAGHGLFKMLVANDVSDRRSSSAKDRQLPRS
jgi:hypothetical protein